MLFSYRILTLLSGGIFRNLPFMNELKKYTVKYPAPLNYGYEKCIPPSEYTGALFTQRRLSLLPTHSLPFC